METLVGGVPVGLDPMCNGTRNWMPKSLKSGLYQCL